MAGNVTVIGRAARVRGRVTGSEDLEVRGFVDGEIAVDGDVTVEAEGLVGAGVQGKRVVVRGAVRGDLVATDSIQLEEGARVVGDLRAPRVAIAPGALVRGYVEIGAQDGGARTARAATAARTPAAPPVVRAVAAPTPARAAPVPKAAAAPAPVATPAPAPAPAPADHAHTNHAAREPAPRRPPPPVVPALKKAKGQIVKKKER